MKHKPILYKQILIEKKEESNIAKGKVNKSAMFHNGLMYALSLSFKIIIIVIITLILTILATAIANACLNGKEITTVLKEMYDNIIKLI